MATANVATLKEGYLIKRQRGMSAKSDSLKKLKFQQRYVRLDEKILDYFKDPKVKLEATCRIDGAMRLLDIALHFPAEKYKGWFVFSGSN